MVIDGEMLQSLSGLVDHTEEESRGLLESAGMTDHFGDSSESNEGGNRSNDKCTPPLQPHDSQITIELPADLVAALQQTHTSGQTPTELILEVLRSTLVSSARQDAPSPAPASSPPADWLLEVQALKARLAELEQLVPKMEELEGKLPAF